MAIFLSCFGDFSDFSYFFPGLFRIFGCCFRDFSSFSYFFMDFSGSFAVILGDVLEVLGITATQGLPAINLWLLYIMLI